MERRSGRWGAASTPGQRRPGTRDSLPGPPGDSSPPSGGGTPALAKRKRVEQAHSPATAVGPGLSPGLSPAAADAAPVYGRGAVASSALSPPPCVAQPVIPNVVTDVVINRRLVVDSDDQTPCSACERATPPEALLCDNVNCQGLLLPGFFCGPACAEVTQGEVGGVRGF